MTPKQERRRERRAIAGPRGYSPTGALGLVVAQCLTKCGVRTLYLPTDPAEYSVTRGLDGEFVICPKDGSFTVMVQA